MLICNVSFFGIPSWGRGRGPEDSLPAVQELGPIPGPRELLAPYLNYCCLLLGHSGAIPLSAPTIRLLTIIEAPIVAGAKPNLPLVSGLSGFSSYLPTVPVSRGEGRSAKQRHQSRQLLQTITQ